MGLTCLALCCGLAPLARSIRDHGHNKRQAIRQAKRYLKWLQQMSLHMPDLCGGKVFIIQAEIACLNNKWKQARLHYTNAIGCAVGSGMLHDQALFLERYGRFLLATQPTATAKEVFQKAISTYQESGALAKQKHLEAEVGWLL